MNTQPNHDSDLRDRLTFGLSQLEVAYDAGQISAILQYVDLLQRWNKRMNLIGSIDNSALITRHILDCAAIVPWLKGTRIADIGTGAGLPGVVLAILSPQREYYLIDSRQKRTQFLRHVVAALNLGHVEVARSRVEQYPVTAKFDTLVSRAFSQLDQFVALSSHLCADTGQWLAMKGRVTEQELNQLTHSTVNQAANWQVTVQSLDVPLLDEERNLVIVQR